MTSSFSGYTSIDSRLGKVNSDKWYQTAYQNCVTDSKADFLCPIILATDETVISDMENLHANAMSMPTFLFDFR